MAVDNAKIQMTEVKQPKPFRRLKCKTLPTMKVRLKEDGAKGQVITINEADFDKEIHTQVRVPLKKSAKDEGAGGDGGDGGE